MTQEDIKAAIKKADDLIELENGRHNEMITTLLHIKNELKTLNEKEITNE